MINPMERRSLLQELMLRGIRITGQRKVLIETIQSVSTCPDAGTLLELVRQRDRRINRATVYRTLELLKRHRLLGELDRTHLTGEKHHYETKKTIDHVHLSCLRCGRTEEFTSPLFEQLKAEINHHNGFQIVVTRLEVGGKCSHCVEKPANN